MFFTKSKEKKYIEEMSALKHEIEDLKQIIKTQELIKLRAENARLLEKEKNINLVHLKLKDIAYVEEENIILVKYEPFSLKIMFNDKGGIVRNDTFCAINELRLLSFDDMKKVQAVIDNTKKLQSKNNNDK